MLKKLGVDPKSISSSNLEEAYGHFKGHYPFLALRYHGYQFGTYNSFLGDGRGFLYGQVRDCNGELQDLGTKGSGTTPWSRGGDGRLTLKGGLREIIASEALHRLGVSTSRTLSLIETGEKLWRGDEPSPTRSSVMVRVARTHLRFGTCERLLYLRDAQHLERLLRHVVENYYPNITSEYPITGNNSSEEIKAQLLAFYSELVQRIARLVAEWMAAGFTHGVLNTDNMSLVGESFDYGPFAFLNEWDPNFTAAYFDEIGLYSFGRQPATCYDNLRLLQEPFSMLLPREPMKESLECFSSTYQNHFRFCLKRRLGLPEDHTKSIKRNTNLDLHNNDLIKMTLDLLSNWQIEYGSFFTWLTTEVKRDGLPPEPEALDPSKLESLPPRAQWINWRDSWWFNQHAAVNGDPNEEAQIPARLQRWNLKQIPTRLIIEGLWKAIEDDDNWEPFQQWLKEVCLN